MTTLSHSLRSAADTAEHRAQEALADGDPEGAEAALATARQLRRLAYNHAAAAGYQGKPELDPEQIAAPDADPATP